MNVFDLLAEMTRARKLLEDKIAQTEAPLKSTIAVLTGADRELLREAKDAEERLRYEAEREYVAAYKACEAKGGAVRLPVGVAASWSTVREVECSEEIPREWLMPDVKAIAKAREEIPGTVVSQRVSFRVSS